MRSSKHKSFRLLIIALMLQIVFFKFSFVDVSLVLGENEVNQAQLTEKEISWIKSHPTIRLAPDPNFEPIEFFDKNDNYKGLGADYVELITKKLGIKFEVVKFESWNDVVAKVKSREVDVLNAVVKTPQREKYLLFPPPYLKIPSVIIVRNNVTEELTLDMLNGKHIIMVHGYGYVDLIRENHPDIEIELVSDLKSALRKVSFGMADAFVGDLATASFYIESEGITNLKLAGETEPPNISGFAVRSDWPELSSILEKGVSLLTEEERKSIQNKWIHLGAAPGLSRHELKKLSVITVAIILLITGMFFIWNRTLNFRVRQRTEALEKEVLAHTQAQHALIESEEKFRTLTNTSPLAIYMSEGIDQRAMYVNPTFTELFGYTINEIPSIAYWWPLAYPDENYRNQVSAEWQKKVAHAINTNSEIEPMEVVVTCKDGSKKNVSWGFVTIGKQNWAFGLDLTKRKQAENALHESQTIFQAFLENSPVYIFFKDHEIRSLMLSKNFEKLIGMPLEKIIGKTMDDLFPSELAKKMIADDQKILQGGVISNIIEKLGERTYETTKFPIFIKNKPNMLAGFTLDITDRIKAAEEKNQLQAQLLHTQKIESLGTLAGGIAHDFNNILSSVLGFSELALEEVEKGSTMEYKLQEIYAGGLRAKEIVNQILIFARKSDEGKKPIRVDTIITEALKLIRPSTPTTIEIRKEIESTSLVMGNSTQIHQIIMNLCTNAAHAMLDNGGIMEVALKDVIDTGDVIIPVGLTKGKYIKLTISDTGCGIDPENIDSIFDPYFTTKATGEGTGMGLAMVRGIVESYAGFITVESIPFSKTVFTIYLPITSSMENEIISEPETLSKGYEHILFVDDDSPIARMGSRLLESLGYQVTTRTSSIEALKLFEAQPGEFQLVITDMTMPHMTGDKFAIKIRQIRADIPIILCTGYSNKISAEIIQEIGIDAFMNKPFSKVDLAKTIRTVLDKA